LAKNTAREFALLTLTNLYRMQRQPLPQAIVRLLHGQNAEKDETKLEQHGHHHLAGIMSSKSCHVGSQAALIENLLSFHK
jgi:hypothetical protein